MVWVNAFESESKSDYVSLVETGVADILGNTGLNEVFVSQCVRFF